jgi:hypothetical protein
MQATVVTLALTRQLSAAALQGNEYFLYNGLSLIRYSDNVLAV